MKYLMVLIAGMIGAAFLIASKRCPDYDLYFMAMAMVSISTGLDIANNVHFRK